MSGNRRENASRPTYSKQCAVSCENGVSVINVRIADVSARHRQ